MLEWNGTKAEDLYYKRGFLCAQGSELAFVRLNQRWKKADLPQGFVLAYDPLNKVSFVSKRGVWLCLCGSYCMDAESGHMNFQEIAENLLTELAVSEKCFYDYLDRLNGRFVCIFSAAGHIAFLNDASAARSVFYSVNKPVFASHYNLVQELAQSAEDPFYPKYAEWVQEKKAKSEGWPWIMPANRTPWADIRALPCNHLVSIPTMRLRRFYPRRPMEETDVDTAAAKIADLLKRQAAALCGEYRVIQSLTAGADTRISLAAVREHSREILFFTYHDAALKRGFYESEDREFNFIQAKKICEKERLNFREIVIPAGALDPQLSEILHTNHYHSSIPKLLLPYSELFTEGSIHLRSNLIEIIRGNEHAPLNKLPSAEEIGKEFASWNNYNRRHRYFAEVAEIFEKYYSESELDNIFDYPAAQLLYWEYRMALWLNGAVLAESDLACDTFMLFNCRKLLDIGLAIPAFYRNRSVLYDRLLRLLWPDLLDYGIPNSCMPLYDCFNKNNFLGNNFRFRADTVKMRSGNLFAAGRKVNALFEPYVQGMTFGFSENKLKKGDWCSVGFSNSVSKGADYFYQFHIKTNWMQGATGGIGYQILLNGQVIYRRSTTDFYSVNQIRYGFRASEDRENKIEIRIVAEKDFNSSLYVGTIDIVYCEFKRDFSRSYEGGPQLIDTFSGLQQREYDFVAEVRGDAPASGGAPRAHASPVEGGSGILALAQTIARPRDVEHLAEVRNGLFYAADKGLLADNAAEADIGHMESVPEGRFSVDVRGVRFNCLFHKKDSPRLYVVLNGSKTAAPPEFKRWSWYSAFEGSMLNIADPSYTENEKLSLGWYFGTKEADYRALTAELVQKVAQCLKIKNEDICFYASSGGGAAALHCGALVEGSTVIAINPQIFLHLYHYAPEFTRITGIELAKPDPWHRENGAYYLCNAPKTNFLLVENIASPDDAAQIFALEKVLKQKFRYGLNKFGNIGIWLYDIGTEVPHNAQEDQILYFAVDRLAKMLKTERDWSKYNEYYLILAEMWRKQLLLADKQQK